MGDDDHPYNIFDFTLNRGRDGPKYFLKDYNQVLLADAYGGYNGVVAGNDITRAGCWAHLRRKIIEAEKARPRSRARPSRWCARSTPSRSRRATSAGCEERSQLRQAAVGCRCWPSYAKSFSLERTVAAQASHGRGDQLRPEPVAGTERVLAPTAQWPSTTTSASAR